MIGTPFYVMEMVEGRIFWDPAFREVAAARAAAYFDAMNATIAALHRIDPEAAGLGDYRQARQLFRAPDRPLVEAISRGRRGRPGRGDGPAGRLAARQHPAGASESRASSTATSAATI